jgi:hypothetical protein
MTVTAEATSTARSAVAPGGLLASAIGCRSGRARFVVWVSAPAQQCANPKESDMAQYVVLIYEEENAWDSDPEMWDQVMKAHRRFGEQVAERGGTIAGGKALQPTATATTIRGDVVTDGPFAESKEALGGFYLIEARDLDHAIELARLCPAGSGGVEVRPVLDTSSGAAGA